MQDYFTPVLDYASYLLWLLRTTIKAITRIIFLSFFILMFLFSNLFDQVDASGNRVISSLEIGDRVVDNSWKWEFRTGEDYFHQEGDYVKPVVRIVVAEDHYGAGSGVTLLSEELIGIFAFDNSADRGDYRYECR